ncbi:MAG TPA: HD-GYP domain-containing protein, partial [Rectinemataceae bacterium]|nr:HD-GYP domain-containing protein [Rectinemataceae bacterium]
MKKRIVLDQIRPGSRFSDDVFIDEKNLLVPANVAVKQRDLDTLKRWGVNFVITEGGLIEEAAAKQGLAQGEAAKLPQGFVGSRELYGLYTGLVEGLGQVFARIRGNEAVETKAVDQLSQGVLGLLRDRKDATLSAILSAETSEYNPARAAVDCAILSVVIGTALRLPPYRLGYLATGALLHDAGMLRIPESILRKNGSLTEEEAQKIRAHPLLSYRIVTKDLLYPDDVGLIGLQHHERWDGDGYPRKTGGQEIDVLARIVSVADAFEAMVSSKPYRNSMIGYAAMKALLSDNSRRFDPDIIKAFIKSMGIYPLGSTVLLNNAAIARVVETHPDAPLRP